MSTATMARTITGRHPITGEAIPVTLAADETVIGYGPDGTPLVQTADLRFGSTFGVRYLCRGRAYDDREAFDPLGTLAW